MGKVLVNETSLSGIANAIRSKNGTTTTYKPSEMAAAISAIETGGGGTAWVEPDSKDVNFYDYDGTRLYSYTLAEAKALTQLPTPPEHDGLVFQGWNWTLEDIAEIETFADIGAHYVTDDNKTRIYIEITEEFVGKELTFGLKSSSTLNYSYIFVDFGNGTVISRSDFNGNNNNHKIIYNSSGNYVVTVYTTKDNADYTFTSGVFNVPIIKKIELGYNIKNVGIIASQPNLTTITVTSSAPMADSSNVNSLPKLKCFVFPRNATCGGGGYTFSNNSSMTLCFPRYVSDGLSSSYLMRVGGTSRVAIPKGVTNVYYDAFNYCNGLQIVDIPDTCTKIANRAFENAGLLRTLYIHAGDTLTINEPFSGSCPKVQTYYFTSTTPPVLSSSSSLKVNTGCKIYVPAGCGDTYKNATNWTTYADYIVEMEA